MKQEISLNKVIEKVRSGFEKIADHRAANASISLTDILMSAFAMFSLKDSSLLEFDERRAKGENLKSVYGLGEVPCDTTMRAVLDCVPPEELKPQYKEMFRQVEKRGLLKKFEYLGQHYLVSVDGTGYFSSSKVHCSSCLEKKNSQTGQITYTHQFLGAAIVHPQMEVVIPLAPEPIIKQDGETKNDCERNAAKRFLAQLRADYPHLSIIIVGDGLTSNGPYILNLKQYNLHYILGVKEGDHAFLFDYVNKAEAEGRVTTYQQQNKKVTHRFRFINQVPLNGSHQDILVNFIEYWEIKGDKVQHFCWITDFTVSKFNIFALMEGGRARWKIENETFNTLKNQGYNFEHNYGHGKQNLSVNFAMLMMLAFMVDQMQQLASTLFQAVLKKEGSRKRLWEHMRALFYALQFNSMEDILRALLYGYKIEGFVILGGT